MNEAYPLKSSPFGLFLLQVCEGTQDQFERKFIYQMGISGKREVFEYFVKKFKKQSKKGMDKESLKSLFQKSDLYTENFKLKEDFDQLKKNISENMPKVSFLRIL